MNNIPKKYHLQVRKLIKKAREDERTKLLNEIREMAEGMKPNYKGYQPEEDIILDAGYNYALDDLLTKIKEL